MTQEPRRAPAQVRSDGPQLLEELHGISALSAHHVPSGRSDVLIGKIVEAEAGVENAGGGGQSLSDGKRLAVDGLPSAQMVGP